MLKGDQSVVVDLCKLKYIFVGNECHDTFMVELFSVMARLGYAIVVFNNV